MADDPFDPELDADDQATTADGPDDPVAPEAADEADQAEVAEVAEPDGVDDEDENEDDAPVADSVPVVPAPARRTVVSKRVTPKGGGPARSSGPATKSTKAATATPAKGKKKHADEDDDVHFNSRYTPPGGAHAQLPSPWWVPALMFGLIIIGALLIMLNYMEVFGAAENWRLIVGLGFVLGGIIAATQYR